MHSAFVTTNPCSYLVPLSNLTLSLSPAGPAHLAFANELANEHGYGRLLAPLSLQRILSVSTNGLDAPARAIYVYFRADVSASCLLCRISSSSLTLTP